MDAGAETAADIPGYLGLTENGTLLLIRDPRRGPIETDFVPLAEVTELLVSESLMGARMFGVKYQGRSYKFCFNHKIPGKRFPNQSTYTDTFMAAIQKRAEEMYGSFKLKKWNLQDDAD